MATWVITTIATMAYWGIVFLMVVENVLPPIPSEVIMPLAGFMATQGRLSLLGVILAGTLGSVLGAVPLYYLGRLIGDERLKGFADRHGRWLTVSREDLDNASSGLIAMGGMAVLLCRLVPGVRSLISIPAGIEGMPLAPFLLFTTLGPGSGRPCWRLRAMGWGRIFGRWKRTSIPPRTSCWRSSSCSMSGESSHIKP